MLTVKNVALLLNCFCFGELQTNNDTHNILFVFHKDYKDFNMVLNTDFDEVQLKENVLYNIFKFIKADIINIDTLNNYICNSIDKYFNVDYDTNKWLNIIHSRDFTLNDITKFMYNNYVINN